MGVTIAPVSYRIRKLILGPRTLEQAAREVITLCPEERGPRPPAYFLPGQMERIVQLQGQTTEAVEAARVAEGEVVHAPTLAYRFEDVALLGGCVFGEGLRFQMTADPPPSLPLRTRLEMEEVALVGSPISDIYFGHYLMDDSAATLLAEPFAPVRTPQSRYRPKWTHARDYRALMGMEVPELPDARLRRAWLFQDFGMNSSRRRRMQQARARLLAAVTPERQGHGVFIWRASAGRDVRILENEAEVAAALEKRGYLLIDPMQETAAEVARKIAGAAIVVSVEGSAITHAWLTMAEDGAMVTIQPPRRFTNVWKDFADLLGIRYGFIVADEGTTGPESFRVDIDDLLRTIDLTTG